MVRSRSRGAGLAIAAGLALASPLGCDPSEPPLPADPTPAVSAEPPAPAAWRPAMLSIYFHARFDDADWLPAPHRPLPLREAAQILREDRTLFARARQRRAIARLYLASPRTPARRDVLEQLGAPLDRLDEELAARLERITRTEGAAGVGPGLIGTLIGALERYLPPEPEECQRSFPATKVDFDWQRWISKASFTSSVGRSLDEMRPVLDPQNWAVCHPGMWQASYVVGGAGSGSQDPPPEPGPPRPGSAWSGLLFEHVVNDWGPFQIWFKVLLKIRSEPGDASHFVGYDLGTSIASSIVGDEKDGGILVDEGWLKAQAAAAQQASTVLEGQKLLQLGGWGTTRDFFNNFWTAIALEQMSDEIYEAVCCKP